MTWGRAPETDSGWVGAGPDDDLDQRLAEDDAPFDGSAPHVMTLLGPIEPGALGVTSCGEWLSWRADDEAAVTNVDDQHATLVELDDAYSAGLRSVVDLGDPGGRVDLARARWLAERASTHIVAPAMVDAERGRGAAEERLIAAIATYAGGIGLGRGDDEDEEAIASAVAAMRRTGAPLLLMDADEWERAVARLERAGADPGRVIVVVSARRLSEPAARAALARGVCVAATDVLADGWEAATAHAATIASVAGEGHGERIVVGSGLSGRSMLRAYGGGPGWSGLIERFPLLLMEAGLDAMAVRALLVDNPGRALTIEPPHGNEASG